MHPLKHNFFLKLSPIAILLISLVSQVSLFENLLGPTKAIAAEKSIEYFNSYAQKYSVKSILESVDMANQFLNDFIEAESGFYNGDVGYSSQNGMTYDGFEVDPETGQLKGIPRLWSAASKESLHLILLAQSINGNPIARKLISQEDAIEILEKKIQTLNTFKKEYPAFGGFLPWFAHKEGKIEPTWDWQNKVPSLDNGQFAWAIFLTADSLKQNKQIKLAKEYQAYFETLIKNAPTLFYEKPNGKIRAETKIKNPLAMATPGNYSNHVDGYYLDDPYEGELMAVFMTLFCNLKDHEKKQLWEDKQKKLEPAVYTTKEGKDITVIRGHWYSAHEVWKYFVLPYVDSETVATLFKNGEKVRTYYSNENEIPGFFASTNPPVYEKDGIRTSNRYYISAVGIPQIARKEVEKNDVITPYSAFGLLMADLHYGAAWLANMLFGPRMIGPFGITESITVDGKYIAPLLTWDNKATLAAALVNSPMAMRDALKRAGVYDAFIKMIDRYHEKFKQTGIKGSELPFLEPSKEIPQTVSGFIVKPAGSVTDVFSSPEFKGDGILWQYTHFSNGKLSLRGFNGYVWTRMDPVDTETNPWINFSINTEGGGVFIEIKNSDDVLITGDKIYVKFPNTGGNPQTYSANIEKLLRTKNKKAGIFVFSDPTGSLIFDSITFTTEPKQESQILLFDDRRFVSGNQIEKADDNSSPLNLITKLNFNDGGRLIFKHKRTLILKKSRGWLWAPLPTPIDIDRNRLLRLKVKTNGESAFYLELKNTTGEQQIIGKNRRTVILLPDTKMAEKIITISLSKDFTEVKNKVCKVIAISDPEGDMEILEMSLVEE
jgi:hypothetical protein